MAKRISSLLLVAGAASTVAAADDALCVTTKGLPVAKPVIIGHRGAAGYLPDHTLEGYTLAIETGVDFIEPDLVSTKDGVLVARHEPNIIETTDVASHPEFKDRKRNVTIDGEPNEGFFVSDFTLKELKTLRAVQPLPERDQSFNGKFEIPTLDEIIALAQNKTKATGKVVGIYPETKHPTWHRALGLPLEEKLLAALKKANWTTRDAPVIIQSFETSSLKMLRNATQVPLAQLVDASYINLKTGDIAALYKPYDWTATNRSGSFLDMLTPKGLAEVATYADIVAPYKRYIARNIAAKFNADGIIVDVNGDGNVTDADYIVKETPQVIQDAHAAGLKVHVWTFRDEPYRLAVNYSNNATNEYLEFFTLGVDGAFSDNCKTAVPARDAFVKEKEAKCGKATTNSTADKTATPAPGASAASSVTAIAGVVVASVMALATL